MIDGRRPGSAAAAAPPQKSAAVPARPWLRQALVLSHRWCGLALAGFLFVAGLTGSIIAFDHELDTWLNPELLRVDSRGPALSPAVLAARVEAAEPNARVTVVPLNLQTGEAARLGVRARIDPATGKPFRLGYNHIFADPVTGAVLGRRDTRACCDRTNIIPFIYSFHYSLSLGTWGIWLMGGVALVWTVDSLVALALTFPRGRPFFAKWRSAWQVKTGSGAFRVNFDLHRAGGLWLWGLIVLLAVTSIYLNLRSELFRPVVELFSPVTPSIFEQRKPVPAAAQNPRLTFDDALALGRAEAIRRGWRDQPGSLIYSAWDMYIVVFRPSQSERGSGLGAPSLYFDAADGRLLAASVPGEGTAGDLIMDLQLPIHSGEIVGLAGRIAVCIAGIVIAVLSVTGVIIWWKKRQGRIRRKRVRTGAWPDRPV
jgi:uncharacterized iron-regulated membrane protein